MTPVETRRKLIEAALEVLEREGSAGFSTRAVCGMVDVGAPTLYHHFGSADGLLSAAVADAFEQFLQEKAAASTSADPETSLREGWDAYVRFAAERPRLYAAMLARLLDGASIPAADQAFALLTEDIHRVAEVGRLAMTEESAALLAWGSVSSVALLHVTTALGLTTHLSPPDDALLHTLREQMISAVCLPAPAG